MPKMTPKQYLSQALAADKAINRKIDRLADFYAARMAEGELPEYWHYKGEIKTTAASSETKKEVAAFLKAAAELLGDSSLTELAGTL